MKQIPQVSTETPPKEDKLVDRVARRNPKVYDVTYDPVVLEEWIREMEKIFTVVEVPEEKEVNIGTYSLQKKVVFTNMDSSVAISTFTVGKTLYQ